MESFPDDNLRIVCLDRDWERICQEREVTPSVEMAIDNLAYVIYTSGSTGNPKGTMISHSNVTRLFSATAKWFQFNERDVWTLFHSYAFDFSVWELWGALCHGGRLVVVPFQVSRDPEAFHELLCQEQVTILNQTPSAFGSLTAVEADGARQSGAFVHQLPPGARPGSPDRADLQHLRAADGPCRRPRHLQLHHAGVAG